MSLETALKLKNAVLRLAASSENGMEFTASTARKDTPDAHLMQSLATASDVLLIASGSDWTTRVQKQVEHHRVTALERDVYDLSTDFAALQDRLYTRPIVTVQDLNETLQALRLRKQEQPRIPSDSISDIFVDVTLNGLQQSEATTLLSESFRVLRRNGRLYLKIYLTDEPHPHPVHYGSGVVSYLPQEQEFTNFLGSLGFHGASFLERAELPVKIVSGVEVRIYTVAAFKGKQGVCLDQGHAVIYKGPWKEVSDDDGHVYPRGARMAVCAKTYGLLQRPPYADLFFYVPAYLDVPLERAPVFDCNTPQRRDPRVTKGVVQLKTSGDDDCCTEGSSCCT